MLKAGLHPHTRLSAQGKKLTNRLARELKSATKAWIPELEHAFVRFGETVASRFKAVALRRGAKTFLAGEFKDADPPPDFKLFAEEALQIAWAARDMNIILKSYGGQYLDVANMTFESINTVMGLGVNMSDYMQSAILKTAGRRLGLIDLETSARDSMFAALEQARSEGLGVAQMVDRIAGEISRGRWSTPEVRAEIIARTETKYAQNASSLEAYRSENITDIMIFDAQLGPTDEECEELNGTIVGLEEAMALMESEHPNGTRSFAPVVG